jgi:hypothetical protein
VQDDFLEDKIWRRSVRSEQRRTIAENFQHFSPALQITRKLHISSTAWKLKGHPEFTSGLQPESVKGRRRYPFLEI